MAIAGAVVLLVTLVVLGAYFLYRSLPGNSGEAVGPGADGGASAQSAGTDMKVLYIKVVGEATHVQVRVPGGEVITDTEMSPGQYAAYSQPRLDVTIGEPSEVQVFVEGEERDISGKDPDYSFRVETENAGG